ncbi:hypothetical protein SEVIR_6G250850v4 [Setaria viridis]
MSRPQQLSLFGPLRDKRAIELQFLFADRASTMKEAAKNFLCRKEGTTDRVSTQLNTSYDYSSKAATLADTLRLPHEGDEAWSNERRRKDNINPPMIKVSHAFTRILEDLQEPGNKQTMPLSSPLMLHYRTSGCKRLCTTWSRRSCRHRRF